VGQGSSRLSAGADWCAEDLAAAAAIVLRALAPRCAQQLLAEFERGEPVAQ
jgi:hypothetical protein